MLISVKENVFKKEVEIKFNNITEGFNRYKNKTISAINEENFERKQSKVVGYDGRTQTSPGVCSS